MGVSLRSSLTLVLWVGASIVGCSSSSDTGTPAGTGGADGGLSPDSGSGGARPDAGSGFGGADSGTGLGGQVPLSEAGATGGMGAGGTDGGISTAPDGSSATPDAAPTTNPDGGGVSPEPDGGSSSSVVWRWGQVGNEPALASGGWVVDSAQGKQQGTTSVHPPSLKAATPVDLTIDCGAQAHTELTFYMEKIGSGTLELWVDGALRQSFGGGTATWDWKKYVFDLAQGTHSYTFRAQSASDASSSFAIDSIECKNGIPAVASNATVDFDQGFIPPETVGGWVVDNVVNPYSDGSNTTDEAAIHPPALKANTAVDMTFDCGAQAHTELTFYMEKIGSGTLELWVDGALRQSFGGGTATWDWRKYIFNVPQGTHSYTFRAQSATDATTSFAVDFLQCKNTAPSVASNATVDFDRGFIPPEIVGGWVVDNVVNPYSDGSNTTDEAAIHPLALKANTAVDMTFNCGQTPHTELTFYMEKLGLGTLDLLIDGALRQSFGGGTATWDWKKYIFDVPQGTHSYTFRAQSASDTATSFAVDFLQCKNNNPAAASNATIDFDQGFIPPEFVGGWLVDNALMPYSDGSTTTDEAAIHPPPLKANTPVDLTFDCGNVAHAKLTFYMEKIGAGTLDLLIDGVSRDTLGGTTATWDWKKYTYDVTQGTHKYTFRAQSASDTVTSFALDFVQCTP